MRGPSRFRLPGGALTHEATIPTLHSHHRPAAPTLQRKHVPEPAVGSRPSAGERGVVVTSDRTLVVTSVVLIAEGWRRKTQELCVSTARRPSPRATGEPGLLLQL